MALRFINRHKEGLLVCSGVLATLYGGMVLWKDNLKGGKLGQLTENEAPKDRKRVYVVTGANSGIGKEAVTTLARKKHKVYMLCRDMEKCEAARSSIVLSTGNKYVYCRPCDLASQKSVRKCAQDLLKSETKIDGLLNNAGVMFCPRSFTEDGIETHWAVNHLSHFLLTRLLTSALKEAGGGRVVFMVHLDYRNAKGEIPLDDLNMQKVYDKSLAFYRSQLANVLTIKELALELADSGITVNGAYPGVVNNTQLKRYMGVDKSMTAKVVAKPVLWTVEKGPKEGAETPLFTLLDKSLNNVTGKLYARKEPMEMFPEGESPDFGKKLMAINDYWTGLKEKGDLIVKNKQKIP